VIGAAANGDGLPYPAPAKNRGVFFDGNVFFTVGSDFQLHHTHSLSLWIRQNIRGTNLFTIQQASYTAPDDDNVLRFDGAAGLTFTYVSENQSGINALDDEEVSGATWALLGVTVQYNNYPTDTTDIKFYVNAFVVGTPETKTFARNIVVDLASNEHLIGMETVGGTGSR
jgi:hypothetical protein